MFNARSSGALMHPTSLPGPFGIGDIGPRARRFAQWLTDAGQKWWQILPLQPTRTAGNENNCPYCSSFVHDRSPWLISPEDLVIDELVDASALSSVPSFPTGYVDFPAVMNWKGGVLTAAVRNFRGRRSDLASDFSDFCGRSSYLADSALFNALRDEHDGQPWPTWKEDVRDRDSLAMRRARDRLQQAIEDYCLVQFLFHRQWMSFKQFYTTLGLRTIGDIPIYVANNSAPTWSHRDQFLLDAAGRPTLVSGVPPDYFNSDGQLWGNPLYNWQRMAAMGYDWWIERVRHELSFVDVVRLDHFRGYEAYWAILAGETSAKNGRWVTGPSRDFLTKLFAALGEGKPIIAEDLGVIDEGVREFVRWSGLPCMRVLQFGFNEEGDNENAHLTHNHPQNCVVYTGTHDNDTSNGWYAGCTERERHHARTYLSTDGSNFNWTMIDAVFSSRGHTAIVPVQDYAGLGASARMNRPGIAEGNWGWRAEESMFTKALASHLLEVTRRHGRAH